MATNFLSPTLPGPAANAVVAITSADFFAVWIKPLLLYLGAEEKAVRDGFLAWLSCLPEALGLGAKVWYQIGLVVYQVQWEDPVPESDEAGCPASSTGLHTTHTTQTN